MMGGDVPTAEDGREDRVWGPEDLIFVGWWVPLFCFMTVGTQVSTYGYKERWFIFVDWWRCVGVDGDG